MNVLFKISLRNLIRQKRRNFLLGIAIAFGTMVLILASAFSHGISDVLFNKIVVYVAGHLSVNFTQNGDMSRQVFHDGPRMMEIVKKEVPEIVAVQEALGIMSRAIGNGKSDNVIMVGIDFKSGSDDKNLRKETEENFRMLTGQFLDLEDSTIENPVLVSEQKAKYLNVKKGDVLRVRFRMISGQNQAARLTVVGVFKPANSFMSAPVFLEVNKLKKLAGYGKDDIGQIYLRIKNPKKDAVRLADKLQTALNPSIAEIGGFVKGKDSEMPVAVLGFKGDSASKVLLNNKITSTSGKPFDKHDIVISDSLSRVLHIDTGNVCKVTYKAKYGGADVTVPFKVTGFFKSSGVLPSNVMLVNEIDFYKAFYETWPKDIKGAPSAFVPSKGHPLYLLFSPEWILLKRVKTTDELTKLQREIGQKKYKGTTVNVTSMYESASAVLKLEYALHLITFIAVMILFFIILIGVINTLRMTIRERTREIGTIRAIGMRKRDVRRTFILETFFLSLFSALTGTVLAFLAMGGLSLIKIDSQDNPLGMLLVNNHLHFSPTVMNVVGYIILILCITVITAYFPAARAANMQACEALRHFE